MLSASRSPTRGYLGLHRHDRGVRVEGSLKGPWRLEECDGIKDTFDHYLNTHMVSHINSRQPRPYSDRAYIRCISSPSNPL